MFSWIQKEHGQIWVEKKNQMKHAEHKGTTLAMEILCGVGDCESILENYHTGFGLLFWRNILP